MEITRCDFCSENSCEFCHQDIHKLSDSQKEFVNKIRTEVINEYTEWLKKQIIGIDDKTKEILVVRNDRWELANEIFIEEKLKEQENGI